MYGRQGFWCAGTAVLLVALGGCSSTAPALGDSVRHNMALQVINPDPHHPPEATETHSGARAALTQQRYRTGTVIQPQVMSTTSGVEGGSGANSTGSSPR